MKLAAIFGIVRKGFDDDVAAKGRGHDRVPQVMEFQRIVQKSLQTAKIQPANFKQGWRSVTHWKRSWLVLFGLLSLTMLVPPAILANPKFQPETIEAADQGRSIKELRDDVRAFILRARQAETNDQKAAAIQDLCELHGELVRHPKFDKSRILKGLRVQIGSRLKSCQRQLQQDIRRNAIAEKPALNSTSQNSTSLGQGSTKDQQPSFGDFDLIASQMSEQMSLANQLTGGPTQLFAYAGGHWAGPDYGPDLVRLIEETINPDFWERNGGPGRIHYYRPLMIIVVAGSSGVHHDLESMLRTLRMISR